MADKWGVRKTTDERVADKTRRNRRGDLDGRIHRSTPVTYVDPQRSPLAPGMEVYVQPDEPNTSTIGALWFDTDEEVPS